MFLRAKDRMKNGSMKGVTLVELICVSAILLLLAGIALPVGATLVKRNKEIELRRALRTIREALDKFQVDSTRYPGIRADLDADNEEGYPEELEVLVEGVDVGDAAGTRLKYLRRIPIDPMTGTIEWETRSSRDQPDSLFSDNINIFDVRTSSEKIALDDTRYNTW
jgi:general secretion pathway protein G